jgi:hypothetical protein
VDENVKDLNLSSAIKQLLERAPMFKTLMTQLACNTSNIDEGYERVEEEGYLIWGSWGNIRLSQA